MMEQLQRQFKQADEQKEDTILHFNNKQNRQFRAKIKDGKVTRSKNPINS